MTATTTELDSPRVKALLDKRAKAWAEAQDIRTRAEADTGKDLTTEEDQTFTRALDEVERIDKELDQHRRAAGLDAYDGSTRSPAPVEVDGPTGEKRYAEAFDLWMRHGTSELDSEHRTILRDGAIDAAELRAQGVATGGAGGYTVPPEFRNRIIEAMQYVSPMRDSAEVITTQSGAKMAWPTVDDTANEGAIVGENTQVTEQDAVFGSADIDAYMYSSKIIRASFQLLNDTGFDMEGWLAKALGARIGRVQNRHFTVGTGSSQPDGIVTSATVGKIGASGQVTSVTYDDLIDMTESLDPAYVTGRNVGWMFSQSFRKAVRKLKDSQNRPLWEPSFQIGTPDSLLGYGITLNNNVPVPAASAKSAIFGDFKEAYLIRDVQGFQLLRLVERYAEYLQVGFLGFQRSDGTLQNGAAVRAYQHPAS
jgi:HK97 family phage major capsid protein